MKPRNVLCIAAAALVLSLVLACTMARAQAPNPALQALIAAADKEGALTLSWSTSTYDGAPGAARFQAAMNKLFGTHIRVNFLPGADMARIGNQLATEYAAGQTAGVDVMLGAAPHMAALAKLDV